MSIFFYLFSFFLQKILSPQIHSTIAFPNKIEIDYLTFFSFSADYREHSINELTNDSSAAILQMVPMVYRKFLTMKPRNQTSFNNNNNNNKSNSSSTIEAYVHALRSSGAEEMLRNIARYNELQSVLNEDLFGPLQNDSVVIVVQVNLHFVFLYTIYFVFLIEFVISNRFTLESPICVI